MKLHVGCASKIFPGWTNLDIDDLPNVDIIDDARRYQKFLMDHVKSFTPATFLNI